MKFFKILLFYYSLIVVTILPIASFFLLPSPQNIANALLLAPVAFLFWVYATNPNSVNASAWSIRFVIVVVLFSTLGIFSYFLSSAYFPASAPIVDPTLSEVKEKLISIESENKALREYLQEELGQIKEQTSSEDTDISVLGSSLEGQTNLEDIEVKEQIGNVSLKDSDKSIVQVYSASSLSSEPVGTLKVNEIYPFYESRGNWYLVGNFSDPTQPSLYGWVEASLIKEIN